MKSGLMWFEKCDISIAVQNATAHYQRKFGQRPNICYCNQANLNDERAIDGVQLQAAPNVTRYHYWIGVEDDIVDLFAL